MKILKVTIVLLMGLISFIHADNKAKTVIIFDASNSMWGQIKGVPKINIARDALKDVINDWDESELGITVYGHRKKKDCNDIEAVIPVGKVNKKEILSKILKIKPKGMTPISLAIEKVAEELKNSGDNSSIILISDGKDSCDADPCKTVKKLVKQGVKFKAHVIGFDVNKDADKQLRCIADATNGIYVSPKNSKALKKALEEIAIAAKPILINAVDDDFTGTVVSGSTGGVVGDITVNDEYNGAAVIDTDITITVTSHNLNTEPSIDTSGNLTVAPNTAIGSYSIKYKICENANPTNCDQANVEIVVKSIRNVQITSRDSGEDIVSTYQFFTMNNNGEADKKLQVQCSVDETKACSLNLSKGNYLVLSTSGDKKGESLFTITKDKISKENEIKKIIVNMK